MSTTAQQTLSGDTTDEGYDRPQTFLWCTQCEDWFLRSARYSHPHELVSSKNSESESSDKGGGGGGDDEDGEDEDEEPREVGGMFTVRKQYNVTFTATVAAGSEEQAESLADDEISITEDTPVDAHQVHDEVTKTETLTEDDERMEDVPGWPW